MKGFVKLSEKELKLVQGGADRPTPKPLYGIRPAPILLYGVLPLYGIKPLETSEADDE